MYNCGGTDIVKSILRLVKEALKNLVLVVQVWDI